MVGTILKILGQILELVIQAKDEVDKLEKQYAEKRQQLLKALADGDIDKLNQLINEL